MVIARTRTPIAVRVYRTLLAVLLPPRFREQYAGEMSLVFAALYAEATRTGGCRGGLRALGAELPGLLRLAIRERRAERALRAHLANALPRKDNMLVESLVQDLRFAVRAFRRSPAFTAVAV